MKKEMQEYFNIANDHFYKNEFQEAVDNYILGINRDATNAHNIWLHRDAYNKMSQAYYNLGKLELAIYANDKVLELDPSSEYGIHNRELFNTLIGNNN
jgi:tetratricopeptide (TPR) repeat protein